MSKKGLVETWKLVVNEAHGDEIPNIKDKYTKVLASTAQGFLKGLRQEIINEDIIKASKRMQEYVISGKFEQHWAEYVENITEDDIKDTLDSIVEGLGEEINAYQIAILLKHAVNLLEENDIRHITKGVVNDLLGRQGRTEQGMMVAMMAESVGEAAIEIRNSIENLTIPELAQEVQAQVKEIPTAYFAKMAHETLQEGAAGFLAAHRLTAMSKADNQNDFAGSKEGIKALQNLVGLVEDNIDRYTNPEDHKGEPEAFGADFKDNAEDIMKTMLPEKAQKFVQSKKNKGPKK